MDASDSAVVKVAAKQHSVFALDQYVALGGTRERARRRCGWGVWDQVHQSVFRVCGSPFGLEARLMAAVLDAGPGAVVSHRAAAWLWDLALPGGVPIEVSVPRSRVGKRRGVIWHRSRDLDLAQSCRIRGIPVTGLARTILDLGACEPERVRGAVWEAMRTHGLTWGELVAGLVDHARRGRPGIGPLREVVDRHYGQIFGVDHMVNERVQQTDALRLNQLELAGYSTLVYTGKMLRSPDALVSDVSRRLRARGWSAALGS